MQTWLPAVILPWSLVSLKAICIANQDTASGTDVTGFDKNQFYSTLVNYLRYLQQNSSNGKNSSKLIQLESHMTRQKTLSGRLTLFTALALCRPCIKCLLHVIN